MKVKQIFLGKKIKLDSIWKKEIYNEKEEVYKQMWGKNGLERKVLYERYLLLLNKLM